MRSLSLPNELCEAPSHNAGCSAQPAETAHTAERLLTITQSADWVKYFQGNAARQRAIPRELGAGASASELTAIAASLRAWQLGETSDGSHLLKAAQSYASKVGDPDFVEAIRLFIAEEQRHGNDLGRFLDLAGVERAKSDWGDSLFRVLRYALPKMEVWATPVVMVETHAMIYYDAIRKATGSVVLRRICEQILADEVAHIRFQCERLAILHRRRATWLLVLTLAMHRVMFAAITIAVWLGHRRALRAGGYGFSRFWRSAWLRMRHAWQIMAPQAYRWVGPGQPTIAPQATFSENDVTVASDPRAIAFAPPFPASPTGRKC